MFKNGSTILPSMTISKWHASIHEHRHRNRHRCGNGPARTATTSAQSTYFTTLWL